MKLIQKQFKLLLNEMGLTKDFNERFGKGHKKKTPLQQKAEEHYIKSLDGKQSEAAKILSTKKPKKPGKKH